MPKRPCLDRYEAVTDSPESQAKFCIAQIATSSQPSASGTMSRQRGEISSVAASTGIAEQHRRDILCDLHRVLRRRSSEHRVAQLVMEMGAAPH
jgi:hypothetical protein